MSKVHRLLIELEDKQIPLDVFQERRNSVRVSVGRKSLILRVPNRTSKEQMLNNIEWVKDWLKKQLKKKPNLLDHYNVVEYHDGDVIHITDKSYILKLRIENRKTNTGRITGDNILDLKLNEEQTPYQRHTVITKLVRRLIGIDQTPQVAERIMAINDTYFKKPIKQVKLKYNTSNWGSCSSSSNINISTRLLCAPKDVQDYVFVHELAHLEELNHSPRFWKIVEDVMPGYKKQEKWLTEYGHTCKI